MVPITNGAGSPANNFVFFRIIPEQIMAAIPTKYALGATQQAAVAAITGLVAKENVVGTFGILYGFGEVAEDGTEIWGTLAASMTAFSAYSFLVFNLLCAPCFAAIGAIKREMNNEPQPPPFFFFLQILLAANAAALNTINPITAVDRMLLAANAILSPP